ncbi:centrosomal protein of 57 kDa-like [Hydractinia symbiolongicarpus]|uniref:centrosomal protein of 57 kDa-like n=1 Tax=Hydractinia symbiolongicarpus TaxID=13093 RepID=UPI00254C741B|nr:centrosomal protein of 57 kDa-like [Hydractinia symbiolongicarpus]
MREYNCASFLYHLQLLSGIKHFIGSITSFYMENKPPSSELNTLRNRICAFILQKNLQLYHFFRMETKDSMRKFSSMLNSPYHNSNKVSVDYQRERSVESPYTSLESGQSSYASISQHGSYEFLKARAEKNSVMHDSKSRAVMEALKGLQSKIHRLESDRTKAENNLKSLATETKDYKTLLERQHVADHASSLDDSHTKELEEQLNHAQSKCHLLEKQLDVMRDMMYNQRPIVPRITSSSLSPVTTSSPGYSVATSGEVSNSPAQTYKSVPRPIESHAMTKLNDLEREHLKLTASQNVTESKIKELEEKIREERHHRKLLQDKAAELQSAVAISKALQFVGNTARTEPLPRTKKRKKVVRSSSCTLPQTKQPAVRNTPHYHLDLANIPFVVGQSTKRSHSLGANIQNVLSIMKSHNKLCNNALDLPLPTQHRKHVKNTKVTPSDEDINELLVTLQDEFAQLGFEHRELTSQIQQTEETDISNDLEREVERIVQKMETKGKQIHVIRDHLKKLKELSKSKKKTTSKDQYALYRSPDAGGVGTTNQTKGGEQTVSKKNVNLDMLKKVRKLQTTLRKDDLNWE